MKKILSTNPISKNKKLIYIKYIGFKQNKKIIINKKLNFFDFNKFKISKYGLIDLKPSYYKFFIEEEYQNQGVILCKS
ncbi:hypothetical protein HN415_07265 [Candidatus Woesearchaeota archaeon]|jgi:hypothetical protein|nr:hypothetical protein [Candidatus Woesearchaeota archaeon]